jgi:hypothetical protein
MVIIKAIFRGQNHSSNQVKFIGAGDSLVAKRYAEVFSQAEAEAKISQLQKSDRFRYFELTTESAIIEEMK